MTAYLASAPIQHLQPYLVSSRLASHCSISLSVFVFLSKAWGFLNRHLSSTSSPCIIYTSPCLASHPPFTIHIHPSIHPPHLHRIPTSSSSHSHPHPHLHLQHSPTTYHLPSPKPHLQTAPHNPGKASIIKPGRIGRRFTIYFHPFYLFAPMGRWLYISWLCFVFRTCAV